MLLLASYIEKVMFYPINLSVVGSLCCSSKQDPLIQKESIKLHKLKCLPPIFSLSIIASNYHVTKTFPNEKFLGGTNMETWR